MCLFAILLFCSCSVKGEPDAVALPGEIECALVAVCGSDEYRCNVHFSENGYSAEFTAPEALSGVSLTRAGDVIKMKYSDMEYSSTGNALPEFLFLEKIFDAFKSVRLGEITPQRSENILLYDGGAQTEHFHLEQNIKSGLPTVYQNQTLKMTVNFVTV